MKKLILRIFRFKRMYILLLFPLSFLLVALARLDNRWVEHFFVRFIYKPLSAAIGTLTSLFPFSVTELFGCCRFRACDFLYRACHYRNCEKSEVCKSTDFTSCL